VGIFFFEILFYALLLPFFGTYVAMICLSIDMALWGGLMLYTDNFIKREE
jgi:hypothetical protein